MSTKLVTLELEISKQDVVSATKTVVCSQKYVELMMKICLINIIYQRLDVPETLVLTKEFHHIPYKGFRPESAGAPLVELYRKWVKGFKDAFQKKYLGELVLFISNDETKDVEEHFKFKFRYEDSIVKKNAEEIDLTTPTENMLRSLLVLGDYPKVDQNKKISLYVELFYVDGTPAAYNPPFFDARDYNVTLRSKIDNKSSGSMVVARLCTGFHYFTCSYVTKMEKSQVLGESENIIPLTKKKTRKRQRQDSEMLVSKKNKAQKKKSKKDLSDGSIQLIIDDDENQHRKNGTLTSFESFMDPDKSISGYSNATSDLLDLKMDLELGYRDHLMEHEMLTDGDICEIAAAVC